MRFVKQAALVAAMCIAVGSTAANASIQENSTSCIQASKQVVAALEATSPSDNGAARKENNRGKEFCLAGFYHQGLAHYAKALELLGVKG